MSYWSIGKAILDVAGAGAKVYSAYSQAKVAEETQELQEKEYLRQQRLSEADARRGARVRQAQLLSAQGNAGITSSATSSGVIGIGTTLDSGISDLADRTQYNVGVSEQQEQASKTQAYATGALGVATFAAGASNFSDELKSFAQEG